MYIILGLALAGAFTGALAARRKGGNRLDIAQYAAVFAIIFAIAGLALITLAGWFLL